MQIRTLFLVCMCTVAALATCLGGSMLTQMIAEHNLAGRVARAVEIDALLFLVSDKIGLERPVVGDALLGDDPIDAPTRAKLAAIRKDADAALTRLESHIVGVSYPGAAEQLAVARQTRADLAVWRANVDATLSQPRSRRDANIFAVYITTLNAIFDATSVALDMGDLAASQHDGTSVELMSLARHVWAVRATMGIRTVPLMDAIDRGVTLDHATLEAQARFAGDLKANWIPITALSRRLGWMPGVAATISEGRTAFDAYDRLCEQVISIGRASASYPVSALALGSQVVRTAPLLLRIRDVALDAARARAAESRRAALVHVVLAAGVMALTCIAMIGVLIVLQRRIVSPVLTLTHAIGRIARLDFDVDIPGQGRMDEIGRMAGALEALRQGAMAGEENKARIVHMANHDALTGLANRVGLRERLDQVVAMSRRGQMGAALCLDLDRFKAVNDTFGHPTGDLLLQAVAKRLLTCVREVDTVSRLGGDEFVVLLAGLALPESAAAVARRIVQALSEPFDLDGQTASIGASVGIAIAPRDGSSGDALLKCADIALYRAKQERKGSWRYFEPEMDAHQRERLEIERDLRAAVRDESFELFFQPRYALGPDARTDRLCGFEAVLRWPHPARGLIGAADFIPIAEEAGLIVPVGEWVLRRACRQAAQWPGELTLAVNLSADQLKHPDFMPSVRQALAESGLRPSRLELEVTETVLLMQGGDLDVFAALHELGIRIAIDDFGAGYSSLSYLRGFAFESIRIDRSFVHDLPDDAPSRAIVGAVMALAHGLGMRATAEGVATEDQLAELRRQGCNVVQGPLFGEPMPAAEAQRLIVGPAAPRRVADLDAVGSPA